MIARPGAAVHIVLVLGLLTAAGISGCGGAGSLAAGPAASRSETLSLVALGDSIALGGAPCGGCRSFVEIWGDDVGRAVHRPVAVANDAVPNSEAADTLEQVRSNARTRTHLRTADLIVLETAINDTPWNRKDDPCHAAPRYPVVAWRKITASCIARVSRQYERTLDAILSEIDRLRAGQPTALRLTTLYNAVIGNHVDRSWDDPAAVAPSKAANARFARIQCRLARSHHGRCVAVDRGFNGPRGSRPAGRLLANDYTHPSRRGHALIARLLTRSGIAPVSTSS